MLALILLVLVTQLSLKGATGLPWLVKSDEIDGQVKEDEVLAQELKNIVKELSDTLKQDAAPFEGEVTLATGKKTWEDTSEAIDEQKSGSSVVLDQANSHENQQRNKVLTRKVLVALRKERERKRQEKELSLHSLYLFQKPQMTATATSFQDFLNYFRGVGQRIKDYFTKHPVMTQEIEDSILSQEQPVAKLEEESDHAAQMQDIEEALVQEMFLDILNSAVMRGRVRKRDANSRNVLLQILKGLPFVMQSDLAHHSTNDATTLIVKDEAIPDERKPLPKLPTHDTALNILYTASSEDIPTTVPAIATTLNHPTPEQN